MYKFTNGIVVFDKKTRDKYIEIGYKLMKINNNCNKNNEDVAIVINDEAIDENVNDNKTIKRKSAKCNKQSK